MGMPKISMGGFEVSMGWGVPKTPGGKRARLGTVAAMDNTKTDRTVDGRPNAIEHGQKNGR